MSEEQRADEPVGGESDPVSSPYETSEPAPEAASDESQRGPSFSGSPLASEPAAAPVAEPTSTYGESAPSYAASAPTYEDPTPSPTADYQVDQAHLQQYSVQPYAQQPYTGQGYAGQQPYGAQAPGYGFQPYTMGLQPEHPRSQTVLILGILGFIFWIPAFFGWYMGGKAKKEIQQGAPYRYEGSLKVGHILSIVSGIIAIAVTALYTLLFLFIIVAAVA